AGCTDGKGGDAAAQPRNGPANQAGIDTAAQQRAYRHVSLQTQANGFQENALGFPNGVLEVDLARASGFRQRPIIADRQPFSVPLTDSTGGQFKGVAINAAMVWNETVFQKFEHAFIVQLARIPTLTQPTHGGSKRKPAVLDAIDKGLNAEPVAHQEQPLLAIVPDGEREHAAQTRHQRVNTPMVIAMDQNFRIGVAAETIAVALKFAAQFLEVVNGAVKNHAYAPVWRKHWLASGGTQVKDRQAAVAQDSATPLFDSFAIRSAAAESVNHRRNILVGRRLPKIDNPRYGAHTD